MEPVRVKSGKGPRALCVQRLSVITQGHKRLMVIEKHTGWMDF